MSENFLKHPEVIHLEKLTKIQLDSLERRISRLERWRHEDDPKPDTTAHLDVQPETLVNPINKALLEALKRIMSDIDAPAGSVLIPSPYVIQFARQAISEAEKGLGGNLGSPVPKGSDTEVRDGSLHSGVPKGTMRMVDLMITLRDIKEELDAYEHGVNPEALTRITTLVDHVLEKAEGR